MVKKEIGKNEEGTLLNIVFYIALALIKNELIYVPRFDFGNSS